MITEAFLMALIMVESGNRDVPGDNGKAQGVLQIHTITVKEANRIIGIKGLPKCFKPSDRHDRTASKRVCKIVLEYHGARWKRRGHIMTPADYAAMWRFGPTAWKPSLTTKHAIDRDRAKAIEKYMKNSKN